MEPQDREPFAQAMLVLAETLEIDLPDGSLPRHWSILHRYPWPLVERGLQKAMCRRWVQFPKPNEIAELIEAAIGDMAERAWLQLQEAVRAVGPHHSIRCEDPALAETVCILFTDWPSACRRLRDAEGAERTMLRKDFLHAYRLAWERYSSSANGYLPGLREIWQANGLNEEVLPVMQIGEADRPRPLAILGGLSVQGHAAEAVEEPGEPIPVEQVKALLDALVTHLSAPGAQPRLARRRLPPALPEAETPERLQAAWQRRDEQYRKVREASLGGRGMIS
jgi:hypothetical protein